MPKIISCTTVLYPLFVSDALRCEIGQNAIDLCLRHDTKDSVVLDPWTYKITIRREHYYNATVRYLKEMYPDVIFFCAIITQNDECGHDCIQYLTQGMNLFSIREFSSQPMMPKIDNYGRIEFDSQADAWLASLGTKEGKNDERML